MDTSNILENVPVRQLLESDDQTEQQLGKTLEREMSETLDTVIKRVKPVLRNIVKPLRITQKDWESSDKPPRVSVRGVFILGKSELGTPVIFLDEKGRWLRGSIQQRPMTNDDWWDDNYRQGSDRKPRVCCYDAVYDTRAWQVFPFNKVVAALTTIFEETIQKREKNLESMRGAVSILKRIRTTFGI